MAKPFDKKFGWVIKDFASLQSEKCYSVPVLISDCKWRLVAFPKGNTSEYFSLYLDVYDVESLPCGWRKLVNLRLSIVNQLSQKLSIFKETEHCFDGKSTIWGFPAMLPLSKLHDEDGGFLVNGEVMIVAELDVFEVIGTLDESAKSEEASELLTKKNENVGSESNDLLKKTSPVKVENSVKSLPTKKRFRKAIWICFILLLLSIFSDYDRQAKRKA